MLLMVLFCCSFLTTNMYIYSFPNWYQIIVRLCLRIGFEGFVNTHSRCKKCWEKRDEFPNLQNVLVWAGLKPLIFWVMLQILLNAIRSKLLKSDREICPYYVDSRRVCCNDGALYEAKRAHNVPCLVLILRWLFLSHYIDFVYPYPWLKYV